MKLKSYLFTLGLLSVASLIAGFCFRGGSMGCGYADTCNISLSSLDQTRGSKNLVDVLVIGSGPAGLSAAMYAARSRLHTLVISGDKPGGQLTETGYVENWPGSKRQLGRLLIAGLEDQAKSFGADFLYDSVVAVDFSQWPYTIQTDDERTIQALAVVIASGARPIKLGVTGEEQYWGRGVATCATCDAPFYKNKNVIVVGGGDSAVEKAMQLSVFAKKVTVLVRKSRMRAAPAMQERLVKSPKISIEYNLEVQRVMGDGASVTALEVKNTKTGEIGSVSTDGLFLAIGHRPNTEFLQGHVHMTSHGHIHVTGRSQVTSCPGVFAAGEVEDDYYRQAGVASGDGIKAGLDAVAFLSDLGVDQRLLAGLELRGAYFDAYSDTPITLEHLRSVHDFKQGVDKDSGIVVVDFYAHHCPSCMQMLPLFDSVARRFADAVTFFKVDADQAKDLVRHLNVSKVPTLLIFQNGQLKERITTTITRHELIGHINNLLYPDQASD